MSTTSGTSAASGVQELIDRIRGQGVQAARDQSEKLVTQAKSEAAAIKAKAEAEAKALLDAARTQIATEKTAGAEAIKNAARDALLELRNKVRQAFEVHVRRLVSEQTEKTDFVRSLVLVLAGEAAEKHIKDQDAVVFVSGVLAGGADAKSSDNAVGKKVHDAVLGAIGVTLREGIQLVPDDGVKGGARVKLVGKDLEIDMTDEALSRLLINHLLPRYRAIVQAEEGTR